MNTSSSTPWIKKPIWANRYDGEVTGSNETVSRIENDAASTPLQNSLTSSLLEPPLHSHDAPSNNRKLTRHLTPLDLLAIGVGGTIGSGIFALCGLIAKSYAGPASVLSFAIGGFTAILSGCCYAELSSRMPYSGSSYAYAFCTMGELPAFVTAALQSLEFGLSGSAVARNWGSKVVIWLEQELHAGSWAHTYLQPGYEVNPCAFLISALCTMLLLGGVKESKMVTGVTTFIKMILVLFMAIGGLVLMKSSNLKPFIPPEFGLSGIMAGATSSFFGYLGYDSVCCVAEEAINPHKNVPNAVMQTLLVVTLSYILATLALVGMVPYKDISETSGFPSAFSQRGVEWLAQLTAAGEIITLPIVILVSLMLQTRLQYALSKDGLLPKMFSEVRSGVLTKGTIIAGLLMTIIATFVPFKYLDDFISAGILIAFCVTNTSLVILKHSSPESKPLFLERNLLLFNSLSFITCLLLVHAIGSRIGCVFTATFGLITAGVFARIWLYCPRNAVFGESTISGEEEQNSDDSKYFSAPFVPFLPCLSIFINWYLIAQLSFLGISTLLLYVLFAVVVYYMYGAKNSVGNNGGWGESTR